ncbi:MAG: hypothetical protein ABI224_03550 [Acetobacteraceae bacterium]
MVLTGGLALAGCAYPYGAPGYGYGGGYGYGYGPSYASPVYAQTYGYAPAYAQGYGYSPGYSQSYGYRPGWNGGQQLYHDGNRYGRPQAAQPQRAWNGQPRPGAYQRSDQPAQRAATPQTRSFEHALGFVPN